ncbi:unnamed protein product [Ceutorhynchus assimilis]|uniref:C2H2-type domain-containing protein n=1 Tax=Ceutorhynchus assimilis TaxID=467358 RepID=A0A9N9MWR0_9CUCU|nr:unnamed protein product [Ceutorhynchus assimilis]
MSNQYIFPDADDQQILLQDGSIIWNDQLNEEASLHYFDTNDTIISSSESFATAIDANETAYLSALETTTTPDVTLDDIHDITINNEEEEAVPPTVNPAEDAEEANLALEEINADNRVIVFTIDGGDDLYGIQMIKDDAGNLQKYQFKFRTTEAGQLEFIPETVTLLEETVNTEEAVETEVQTEQENVLVKTSVKTENNILHETVEDLHIKGEMESDAEDIDEAVDEDSNTKSSPLQKPLVKQEEILSSQNSEDEESIQNEIESTMPLRKEEHLEETNEDQEQLVDENMHVEDQFEKQLQQDNEVEGTEFIPEYLDDFVDDTSQTEQYNFKDQEIITPNVPLDANDRINILRHSQDKSEDKLKKLTSVGMKYYVMYPEKENVNSLAANNNLIQTQLAQRTLPKSTNPRSLLKINFDKDKDKPKKCVKSQVPITHCEFYDKRFAKNKEAMHVKNFHSFLNKTTIPHAPVRQKRQPRKQEIKATERGNEEIIVQEVIISDNGFIESPNKRRRNRKLKVTAVVELSDSEDDTNNPSSDITIIEINSDSDDSISKTDTAKSQTSDTQNTLKRRRGRPRKLKKGTNKPVPDESDKLPDKKGEIICPRCPKTFASQNSLNTHLKHHNLENNLKIKATMSDRTMPRQSLLPKFNYNHKCEECQQTFKNTILLKNHKCTKTQNNSNHSCSVCLKKFRDVTLLNIHKKTHAKANLLINTSVLKVSPKKIPTICITRSSPKKSFRCTECPKICESNEKLLNHTKTHKKLVCSSCSATFSSKFLLETHARTNCTKLKSSANNKRLSYTIRKTFVNTPPRRMTMAKPADKTAVNNVLGVKLDCDLCGLEFPTFRSLYMHKVQLHGLNTPNKSLMMKPKCKRGDYKPKAAHGGVPMNPKLQKAYAALKTKMAESTDLVIY